MDIGVWGDSISYGANDKEGLGWAGRLRRVFYDDVYGFYNRGICGDTTKDLLERFDIEATSINPKIVIFAIGINDAKFPNGGSENKIAFSEFQLNVSALIVKAKKFTDKVMLIGLTEVDESSMESPSSIFKNITIEKYDSYLKEIAIQTNVVFIDMKGVLNVETDLDDGLHPNAVGYQKMAAVISNHIKIPV